MRYVKLFCTYLRSKQNMFNIPALSGLALGPVSDQSPLSLNLFIGGGLLSLTLALAPALIGLFPTHNLVALDKSS